MALRKRNTIRGLRETIGGEKQTRQQFVDDTMLMGHPSIEEDGSFKPFLEIFGRAFVLEVSAKNHKIFFQHAQGHLA